MNFIRPDLGHGFRNELLARKIGTGNLLMG